MPSLPLVLGFFTLLVTNTMAGGRIDTHFHVLPPQYIDSLNANGGDPSGFPTPDWSIDAAVNAMNEIGTSIGKSLIQAHPIS